MKINLVENNEVNNYKRLDLQWSQNQLINIINKKCDERKMNSIIKDVFLPDDIENQYYNVLMTKAEELNPTFEDWIDVFHDCVTGDRDECFYLVLKRMKKEKERMKKEKEFIIKSEIRKNLQKTLEHAVRLSEEGTMTFNYCNGNISFAMKIDDAFELRNDNEDGSYSLFYCNELTASPTQIRLNSSDVKSANYYRAGSHPDDECTVDTIEIELIDGSLINLIQDIA